MIVSPTVLKLIQQRKASQIRLPVGPNEKNARYRTGRVYAIQLVGKSASLKITAQLVRQERLADLTLQDARREGFKTRDELVVSWSEHYGLYDPDRLVWVIPFVRGDVTDRPLLLAARPGNPPGDYTDNPAQAMRGEPEPVGAAHLEHYTKRALEQPRAERRDVWVEQRERLANVLRILRECPQDRNVESELRAIERKVQSLDRKLKHAT